MPTPTSACVIHDCREPIPPGSIVCPECSHVYATEQDVINEYTTTFKDRADLERPTSEDEVPFCPLCLHDW